MISFDLWSSHFSQSFAAVYGAELSFSSNDYCSLVTWQMLLLCLLYKRLLQLGATKLTKVNDQQRIYCVFIYSLYLFPALPIFFLYFYAIALRAQTSESTWSYVSFQYSSNAQFGYQVFQDGGVFIERSFGLLI